MGGWILKVWVRMEGIFTVDWPECVDMSTLNRDPGFNVFAHVGWK